MGGAWQAWEDFVFQCQGSVEETYEFADRAPEQKTFHFNGMGTNFRCEWTNQNSASQAAGLNSAYGFCVSNESQESPWRIDGLDTSERIRERIVARNQFLRIGDMVFWQSLRWIMAQPTFKIRDIQMLADAKKGQVRMHFDCNAHDRYDVLGGWVSLDPACSWAVCEFDLKMRFQYGPGVIHGWNEHAGTLGGFPVPVRHVMELRDPGGLVRCTISFDGYSTGDVRESDCRLSAFGLPEPGTTAIASNRSFWLTVSTVCLLILLAVFFRRRAARYRVRSESG